jgi:hypothetical protein
VIDVWLDSLAVEGAQQTDAPTAVDAIILNGLVAVFTTRQRVGILEDVGYHVRIVDRVRPSYGGRPVDRSTFRTQHFATVKATRRHWRRRRLGDCGAVAVDGGRSTKIGNG